jgi:hypothetical protein
MGHFDGPLSRLTEDFRAGECRGQRTGGAHSEPLADRERVVQPDVESARAIAKETFRNLLRDRECLR